MVLLLILIGCSHANQPPDLIVVNQTGHTICKVMVNEDVSIPLPLSWENELRFSKLRDGEQLELHIKKHKPNYMIHVESCDKTLVGSWYGLKQGDTITMTHHNMIDRRTPIPTRAPQPTRAPAIVTIINGSNQQICKLALAVRRTPYQFGNNILKSPLNPGASITLNESEGEIKWAVQVIQVRNCDGTEYITQPFTAEGNVTITLTGSASIIIQRKNTS